jgi:carbon-monoxide dehydrogenase medium subunit
MRVPQFDYFAPQNLEEACSFYAAHPRGVAILAGGTDLLVKMKMRRVVPQYLLNLKTIPGLDAIRYREGDGLRIGALATIQAIKNSALVRRRCAVLAQAAAVESSVQIRNVATLGGNIANASPAADAPLALLTAGASVVVVGIGGERVIPLQDFTVGPGRTVLEVGELIKEIFVPPAAPATGVAYRKHSLRRTDIAIVAVSIVLTIADGRCTGIKVGLGSVAPTIIRAPRCEEVVQGKRIDEELADVMAREAVATAKPISDVRSTAEYRSRAIFELSRSALLQAARDAQMGGF